MARFSRRARVRSARDYAAAFEGGRRMRDQFFDLVLLKNGSTSARLGLAVSKKTLPLATQRNRLKRQIRESFRCHAATLPSIDIIVLPRVAVARADNASVQRELKKLWSRIADR